MAGHARRSLFVAHGSARRWLVLAAVALIVLAAIRFWLHDVLPYLAEYSEASYRRYWPHRHPLLLHIAGGTVALLAGPFQLWSGFRRRYRAAHRWTGYAYVAGIGLSAVSSFGLVFYTRADFGLSLAVLAVAWMATVSMALAAARNGRLDAHREWMMRSYIITFSFVSYRFLVGLSWFDGLGPGRFAGVLWLSWIVPMMLFELIVHLPRVMPIKRVGARPPARELV